MRPSVPDVHISDPQDAEMSAYRPVAWDAVLGMLFGLASPLAFVGWFLWAVPAVGVLLNGRALGRFRRNPGTLTGRKMALLGLLLSLGFGCAAPSDWVVYRWTARREARRFAESFFRHLAQDEPQKAFQFLIPAPQRQPLDDRLWGVYNNDDKQRKGLENFVAMPVVRTLLALGPQASVRFYETAEQKQLDDNDEVTGLFAVTYDDAGEKKSFFVKVQMVRQPLPTGGTGWRIFAVEGGVKPAGWQ
jgi:hypothetical protein